MKRADRNEPEGFAEFWEGVWRKHARHTDGRGLARDAFRKHVLAGSDPQDIIDGAKCFFRTMKERDREFVPLSSTWINREAYIDLAQQEREYQAKMEEGRRRREEVPENVVQMPERRVKTAYMLSWERQHGKDYFEHFDEQKRRAGE